MLYMSCLWKPFLDTDDQNADQEVPDDLLTPYDPGCSCWMHPQCTECHDGYSNECTNRNCTLFDKCYKW